jgi:tRNA dimethylallyltransferase
LIIVLGPTGTGKSRLAIELALAFRGEIVNADSRQVYRFMDIGTAKPDTAEQEIVPHHLYDIVNPDEEFGLAQYQRLANQTIDDIQQKGKLPVLVGGSGQYVWAVLEGWQIPPVPPDPDLRIRLEKTAQEQGTAVLFNQLQKIDPGSAALIDPRNVRRVIRALEVTLQTGQPFSRLKQKIDPGFASLIIGLTAERRELYKRVDTRVDEMIVRGLEKETRNLLKKGYGFNLPSMNSIGYTQIGMYLRGEMTLEESVSLIKYDNHRFIRHQYAWFRLKDSRINWLDVQTDIHALSLDLVKRWMNRYAAEAKDAG